MKEEYLQSSNIIFKDDNNAEECERYLYGVGCVKAEILKKFFRNSLYVKDFERDMATYWTFLRIMVGIKNAQTVQDRIYNLTFQYPSKLSFETIDIYNNVHSYTLPIERIHDKEKEYVCAESLFENKKCIYNISSEDFCLRLRYVNRRGRRIFVEATAPLSAKGSNIFFSGTVIRKDILNDLRLLPLKCRGHIKHFYKKLGIDYINASDDYKHGVLKKVIGPDGFDYLIYEKDKTYATMQLMTLKICEDRIISEA